MTVAFTNQNLDDYAAKVAEMTDDELMVEGQQMHKIVYPRVVSGTGPSVFECKLEICRAEYRKRFPSKAPPSVIYKRPSGDN